MPDVIVRALVLALALAGAPAHALDYRITGVNGALRDNVRAYLGAPPKEGAAVARALEGARSRTVEALQALGHYRPSIELHYLGADGQPLGVGAAPAEVARLEVHIDAGERVHLGEVQLLLTGDASDDEALMRVVEGTSLVPGTPLDHGQYTAFKRELQTLARARGYLDGRFEAHSLRVDPSEGLAEVTLHFASGARYRFGAISHNEDRLDRARFEALLPFASGDAYDEGKLQELGSRLRATGLFGGVSVVPQPERTSGQRVPVQVELVPAPRHSLELGVGFSTDTRGRLSALWRSPRLNKAGHSQETRLRWSPVNPAGSTVYRIPLGARLRDSVQLRASLEDNRYGDLDSRQGVAGVRYERAREVWITSVGVRALHEDWSVLQETFAADYLLPGLTLSRRSRQGSVVDPTSGLSQFYSVEAASEDIGSASDLLRLYGNWRWIGSPGGPHRLVGRLELGALLGSSEPPLALPPSLGFFAGGDQSVRGYDYQSIGQEVVLLRSAGPVSVTAGGDRLVTGSLEYQRYLSDSWRVALFADAGDAFLDDNPDLKVGAGVGIHFLTPVGALKFEVANSVSEANPDWRIHINIGAEL
ncbi:autotransporter assembly complex protein TamA [Pseudohaliea rubra]|uniref:Translocation and assembly module subunit TamA n=1 Tax=Pseudohaliea rubra DSM 19751 TaxID=1265313 RepID=A0A095VSE6_9GAMM|nr:autotransporter assembly complex family protein [Pseudohaliea rubra]KGE04290.1 Outer membrane protein [Pseudohaliea rubra DSM 19751]